MSVAKPKNTCWSDALIEANLCEDIGKFSSIGDSNDTKPFDRDVESYDYSAVLRENPDKKNHLAVEKPLPSVVPREPVKCRLGPAVTFDENKKRPHILVTEIDSEDLVAKEIVKHLKEPNDLIIQRCVKVLGRKKSLEVLYATEDIQENGGMLTAVSVFVHIYNFA